MKYTIKIPQPCHEDWDKMTPTEQGRFCAVCTKEVLDFTELSDKELVERIKSGQKMCGRFRPTQLNREIDYSRKTIFPRIGMFLGITSLLSFSQAVFSQEVKTKTEVVQPEVPISEETYPKKVVSDFVTIKGKVTNEKEIEVANALVLLKGTRIHTFTAANGNFSINIPTKNFEEDVILTFSDSHVKSAEVVIIAKTEFLTIQLKAPKRKICANDGWTTGLMFVEERPTSLADSTKQIAEQKRAELTRWQQELFRQRRYKIEQQRKEEVLRKKKEEALLKEPK